MKEEEIFIARKHNAAASRRKQAKRRVEADFLFRLEHFTTTAGCLRSVTNGNYTATYTYLANSPLVSQITFKSNSVTRMTMTKTYHLALPRFGGPSLWQISGTSTGII